MQDDKRPLIKNYAKNVHKKKPTVALSSQKGFFVLNEQAMNACHKK